MPAPYRRLGKIVKAHGSRGEVTLALREDLSLSHLTELDVWIVPPPQSGARPRRVSDLRPVARGVLARVSGVETAADAHELAGRYLLAEGEESESAAMPGDEYVGLAVIDERRGYVGTVTEIIVTGANDVLVLHGGPFGQVLVPVIDDVMGAIDEVARTLHVRLLDGLIDEDEGEMKP